MMKNKVLKQFDASRWFYIFLAVHVICWTLTSILIRHNLPLDAIESSIWGQQLQWGYDKDPFLTGWLDRLAVNLSGESGWMLYLFCQLSVAACLWAVWQTAKKMLSPVYALISVMLLEGVQYFNFHAMDFNDNVLELGLWGLTTYFFYRALRIDSKAWLLTGFFAGLAMMSKYYTLALLAGMVLFLFAERDNHKHLKTPAPYAGLLIFITIMIPHIIWLYFHDFVTIRYVFARTNSEPSWMNHINYPLQFTWEQFQVFIPSLALFGLLLIGKRPAFNTPKIKIDSFDKSFLLYVCLGPFLLTLLLSLLTGIKLRAGWGMPLLSFWGVILIAWSQPALTKMKLYRFITASFLFMGLLLGTYIFSLINPTTTSTANFPGKEVASVMTKKWHDLYHTKLAYVAGSRWVGGNIAFYSPDHPAVFIEWKKWKSDWINEDKMLRNGALFIWEINEGRQPPADLRKRYPHLQATEIMEFQWQRNRQRLEPIKIGVAILPPS